MSLKKVLMDTYYGTYHTDTHEYKSQFFPWVFPFLPINEDFQSDHCKTVSYKIAKRTNTRKRRKDEN